MSLFNDRFNDSCVALRCVAFIWGYIYNDTHFCHTYIQKGLVIFCFSSINTTQRNSKYVVQGGNLLL
jgi:hypothetical protein